MSEKLSIAFRMLRKLGFNYSEKEYGNITFGRLISQALSNIWKPTLLSIMNWTLLEPIAPRRLRPAILKAVGCKVGKGVFIGTQVQIDVSHASLITIEDGVHITDRCLLLCHQRNLTDYYRGDDSSQLGYILKPIHLKKGCHVGMCSLILPGVTVGEGAIIGAGSLVSKDVPDWTIATGRPARVVKEIPYRN